ncbi:type I methionyl aminopeptidase [Candidatus Beckwithbacteria bacterium CG10_big_fil_rev_8_21_14_0_10_34_10]|uniref:Methionine aminopeptidase n=1 Tax=Candidatus Beckwithbacteria bacterium CG10_big_fil_rev_8_21_14_0_10_34_10 TaxID=1974495 RepID=A0A2H0W9X5_9BACT|nr:MAG: type I methionyl aminopeptidase [Candidatus Beckwithbacteria bacterium CG10_big_fil_rev_8_21_14_0_10_34_10]
MSLVKTSKQIQIMKKGGEKLASILKELTKLIKPGVNLLAVEAKAMSLIKESGGKAGFARVPGYNWATCLNVNEDIVHGIPRDYLIKDGDVVNIDIGLYYKGFNSDMSGTMLVKDSKRKRSLKENLKEKEIEAFLNVGRRALKEAISVAQPGNRVGHISKKIQSIVEGAGFSCAQNLTGHGIGQKLHELPSIPCVLRSLLEETLLLKEGMTLAIEVIYSMGKADLVNLPDKWTIKTKDDKISAVFEETIALKKDGSLILTKLPKSLLTG